MIATGAYTARSAGEAVTITAKALSGRVVRIEPGQDHGFPLNALGTQLYSNRDSVTDGNFADLREGDLVHYVEEASDAGPVATKVRLNAARPRAPLAWTLRCRRRRASLCSLHSAAEWRRRAGWP